ncbi:SDR family NAD(P)-dependent oxidoreductase, partial [Actinacidiphila glaucinigra]|uniref:SDR family NAD(P)-dependent oxidoreductase n=1 Tax=Actinacidiphila glaucinigra TaxID=235986 RepID=UPI0035D903EF
MPGTERNPAPTTTPTLPTTVFQRDWYWLNSQVGRVRHGLDVEQGEGEADFWEAVDRGDVDSLRSVLSVEDPSAFHSVLPLLSQWRRERQQQQVVGTWRYHVKWERAFFRQGHPVLQGRWLVFTQPGGVGTDLIAALSDRNIDVRLVDPSLDRREVVDELSAAENVSGILSVSNDVGATLRLVQALVEVGNLSPVWCLTTGAVSAGGTSAIDPYAAQVWGFGRVVALEHPSMWGGLVDMPTSVDDRVLDNLVAVLAGAEDQVAIRTDGVYARRLTHAPAARAGHGWKPRGTVLITGGTGGLGGHVARWLAQVDEVERIVLASRSGLGATGAREIVSELAALGVDVVVESCDVTDRDAMESLIEACPPDAVVHAAGIPGSFQSVAELDPLGFEAELSAKVMGAAHLHELLTGRTLDAFVLFSSIAGIWGSAGQAAYATANSFLDALAEYRHAQNLPALAVAWGPWEGAGMLSDSERKERILRSGLRAMAPDTAVAALAETTRQAEPSAVVADTDWNQFIPLFVARRRSTLFATLPEANEALALQDPQELSSPLNDFRTRLAGLETAARMALLTDLVREEVAQVLGISDTAAVPAARAFKEAGFDSLTSVELRNRLATRTGVSLPVTLVFDHPTPNQVATYLHEQLIGAAVGDDRSPAPAVVAGDQDDPVVIVGMGVRLPGGVGSPQELWELVAEGRDAVSLFPDNRGWDVEGL